MIDARSMPELREILGDCERCRLCARRANLVFGAGDESARLMFVGEAPGKVEDQQGLPFVGRAGVLLDELLAGIGLQRGQVYITNVVKCRPPDNRDPLPEEMETCGPFLKSQVALIKPTIVCALGRIAAGFMLDRGIQITRVHGQMFERPGCFVVPVFHPAAALRAASTMEMLRGDFENLKGYLARDLAPPPPPAVEPEQLGLF